MKKLSLIILGFLGFIAETMSQCSNNFSLGNDTSLCANQTINLVIPNLYDEYLWNNNTTNSNLLVNTPGTYFCTTRKVSNINLVSNGNFQLGNNFFTTDYTYYPIADVFGPQASYGIINNANTWFNPFNPCVDHTSGNGNMMVIDGSSFNGGNDAVWCQNIFVQSGKEYRFAYWIQSVTNSSILANIQIRINGIVISNLIAPSGACNWQEREIFWTSTTTGNVSFCLYNLQLAGNGNDFALDDISLSEVCKYQDTIIIGAANIDTVIVQEQFCFGDSIFLENAWQNTLGTYFDFTPNAQCGQVTQTELSFFPIDTTTITEEICFGDSIFLEGSWKLNEGNYYDFVAGPNCPEVLQTLLFVSEPDTLDNFIEICPGDSVFLSNAWQTEEGTYFDFIPQNPCAVVQRTSLTWIVLDTTTVNVEICPNDSIFLEGQWRKEAGIYYDFVEGLLCPDVLQTILSLQSIPQVFAGDDFSASYGEIVYLLASPSLPNAQYFWSSNTGVTFSEENIQVEITEPSQEYFVSLLLDECFTYDTISILGIPLDLSIQVPSGFSPNNDGKNDGFQVMNKDIYQSISMQIYNRWGELIYSQEGVNPIWDGNCHNAKPCLLGNYTFFIKAQPFNNLPEQEIFGSITLVR